MATPNLKLPSRASAWTLAAPVDCGKPNAAELREWRGIAGARRACRAVYEGPPPIRVTLFEMPGSPGAGSGMRW